MWIEGGKRLHLHMSSLEKIRMTQTWLTMQPYVLTEKQRLLEQFLVFQRKPTSDQLHWAEWKLTFIPRSNARAQKAWVCWCFEGALNRKIATKNNPKIQVIPLSVRSSGQSSYVSEISKKTWTTSQSLFSTKIYTITYQHRPFYLSLESGAFANTRN